jgi:hypothetical protein
MVESNNNSYHPSPDFIKFVKEQERDNTSRLGFADKAKPVIENVKDGCTHYIGFGHNIKPDDELMNKTINEAEAG